MYVAPDGYLVVASPFLTTELRTFGCSHAPPKRRHVYFCSFSMCSRLERHWKAPRGNIIFSVGCKCQSWYPVGILVLAFRRQLLSGFSSRSWLLRQLLFVALKPGEIRIFAPKGHLPVIAPHLDAQALLGSEYPAENDDCCARPLREIPCSDRGNSDCNLDWLAGKRFRPKARVEPASPSRGCLASHVDSDVYLARLQSA